MVNDIISQPSHRRPLKGHKHTKHGYTEYTLSPSLRASQKKEKFNLITCRTVLCSCLAILRVKRLLLISILSCKQISLSQSTL